MSRLLTVLRRRRRVAAAAAPFVPTDLGAVLLEWEKADGTIWQDSGRTTPASADLDPVGSADDMAGGGRHLLQGTSGARPTLRTNQINGLPAFLFDGGDYVKQAAALGSPVAQPFTRWLVMKLTGTPPAATEVIVNGVTAPNTAYLARLVTTGLFQLRNTTGLTTDDTDDGSAWHLWQMAFASNSVTFSKDGTSIHTGVTGTSSFEGTTLGASPFGASPVQNGTLIAEHLVTAGETAGNITSLKSYFATRYGLTIA